MKYINMASIIVMLSLNFGCNSLKEKVAIEKDPIEEAKSLVLNMDKTITLGNAVAVYPNASKVTWSKVAGPRTIVSIDVDLDPKKCPDSFKEFNLAEKKGFGSMVE